MLKCKTDIAVHPEKIVRPLRRAEQKALGSAGAYLRGVARRKVKKTNNPQKHSAPGAAPLAHQASFKNAIMFAVDQPQLAVYVGMGRMPGKPISPEGKPVSQVLEEGGIVDAPLRGWWRKHEELARRAYAGDAGYLAYYRGKNKTGPAFAGSSAAEVMRQRAAASGRLSIGARFMSRAAAYTRVADKLGKRIWFANIKVSTLRQAHRVRKVIEQYFGRPGGKFHQWPRPLMQLSWNDTKGRIMQFFKELL